MYRALQNDLIALRKAKGLSQKDLAERTGLSQQHVSAIESGRIDPRISTLDAMAHALGAQITLRAGAAPAHLDLAAAEEDPRIVEALFEGE